MDLLERSRRLRGTPILRELVRETRCSKSSLIYPMFVKEGTNIKEEIPSMQGQYRYSPDTLLFELEHLSNIGISSVMLFGIPNHKDAYASGAYAQDGVIQTALQLAKKEFPNLYYITDVCLCEYTSHGHCGMLCGETVDNDSTLPVLAKTALSHVQAGADMVAPSDMMDGRILAPVSYTHLGTYDSIYQQNSCAGCTHSHSKIFERLPFKEGTIHCHAGYH